MPTGYTARILNGEVTTAQEFALTCAHAFIYTMRDDQPGTKIHMPERNDSYYAEELPQRLAALKAWDESSEEEKYAQWSEYVAKAEKRNEESRREARENSAKLAKVLAEVRAIAVPPELKKFKEFMEDQILGTMKFDGRFNEQYNRILPYEMWVDSQRPEILRDIDYAVKGLAKAEERYQEGKAWISALAKTYDLEVVE